MTKTPTAKRETVRLPRADTACPACGTWGRMEPEGGPLPAYENTTKSKEIG